MMAWEYCPICKGTGKVDPFEGAPGCGGYNPKREQNCATCYAHFRDMAKALRSVARKIREMDGTYFVQRDMCYTLSSAAGMVAKRAKHYEAALS
jgi:RecJ-like exonuclease